MNRKAFTLIELLVVVAIIGILAAVGVVAYNGYTSSAKLNAAKLKMSIVIKYIQAETAKCTFEETAMDGNLKCSDLNVATPVPVALKAAQAALQDTLKNASDPSKLSICAAPNPCGGTYNYSGNKVEGAVSLLEHGPTTMQVGFCVKLPCNGPWGYDGGKKNGYIESGYINIITN